MKQIHFATGNRGKVDFVSNILLKHGIEVVHVPLELPEPKADDVRKIAIQKVLAAYDRIRKPVIALDSGFYIHSLDGFPKTNVNHALKSCGINGILRLVEGKPRECEFRHCLAYCNDKLAEPKVFEFNAEGTLSTKPKGKVQDCHWSELALIFIPVEKTKTIAEMTREEYREWETRRYEDCFSKFAAWFSQRKT
jgi:XTP/dITP diphosphohydrolase